MGNRNTAIIRKGHKIAMKLIDEQMLDLMKRVATEALWGAVTAWDDDKDSKDLTGNIRTSFGAAVYRNRKIKARFSVFNTENMSIERPTHGFTYVGDSGFRVYGQNWFIGSDNDPYVQNYKDKNLSFQDTEPGKYGYVMTAEALKNYRPSTDDWTVVVASVTPYGEYLHDVRKLDILETQSSNYEILSKFSVALYRIKDIDEYAKIIH